MASVAGASTVDIHGELSRVGEIARVGYVDSDDVGAVGQIMANIGDCKLISGGGRDIISESSGDSSTFMITERVLYAVFCREVGTHASYHNLEIARFDHSVHIDIE